jgi:hypothetical protein
MGTIREEKKDGIIPASALVAAVRNPLALSHGVLPRVRPATRKGKGASAMSRTFGHLPPPLNLVPTFTKTHRFYNTSAASVTISVLELIGALGGIGTVVNSVVTHWTTSFRIVHLKVYPSVSTTIATNTVVEWNFGLSGSTPDECISVVTPGGVIVAAPCLVFKPPAKSLASDWMDVSISSTNIFNIFNLPNASVLDLTVETTLPVVFSASVLTSTVATAIVGQPYYLALDGPASNKIIPATGYPTTH